MLRLYRCLLWLYPGDYRRKFAEEMVAVFGAACEDAPGRGRRARLQFYGREFNGLVCQACTERLLRCSAVLARCVDVRFNMRSNFRFPISGISFMCVSLVLVVAAIEKAKDISRSLPPEHHHVVIQPFPVSFPQALGVMFAGAYAAGAIAWVVMFAVRRAGVHRLSEAQTWKQ